MRQCEYCERISTQTVGESCKGCGAPIRNTGKIVAYDPEVFDSESMRFLGQPGDRIFNVPSLPRYSGALNNALCIMEKQP